MILDHSLPEDPEQQRHHQGHHNARDDREVEAEILAHDVDVPRQAAERQLRKPRPREAGDEQDDAGNDEEALHGVIENADTLI